MPPYLGADSNYPRRNIYQSAETIQQQLKFLEDYLSNIDASFIGNILFRLKGEWWMESERRKKVEITRETTILKGGSKRRMR